MSVTRYWKALCLVIYFIFSAWFIYFYSENRVTRLVNKPQKYIVFDFAWYLLISIIIHRAVSNTPGKVGNYIYLPFLQFYREIYLSNFFPYFYISLIFWNADLYCQNVIFSFFTVACSDPLTLIGWNCLKICIVWYDV